MSEEKQEDILQLTPEQKQEFAKRLEKLESIEKAIEE